MIEVMLSSTVRDLFAERTAVLAALNATGLVKFLGVDPVAGPSYSSSPFVATSDMAESCHLYLLVLGERYGYVPEGEARSATEIEFDAAYKNDPTKVLVFKKSGVKFERKQKSFVDRVTDYHKGFYVRTFTSESELGPLCLDSFRQWIQERASIGAKLSFFDHFVRIAIQRPSFPGVTPTYKVTDNHVELAYRILDRRRIIHIEKSEIYRDFWGQVKGLERHFENWRSGV